MHLRRFLLTLLLMTLAGTASANTLAITEFINNPDGEDDGREWVEIYNYGGSAVDLSGYTIADEDNDSYTFGAVSIAPTDFLIVVGLGSSGNVTEAQAKAVFEQGWLGGASDARVIGADLGALANSGDEIILQDASNMTIWSLAYDNDEDEDSTALTDATFTTNVFGSKAAPGIVRMGDDNGVAGFLGYEDSGDFPSVFAEDANAIKDAAFLTGIGLATDFYDNVDPDTTEGDPFLLTVVPEPSSLALAVIGLLAFARRRRR